MEPLSSGNSAFDGADHCFQFIVAPGPLAAFDDPQV
jgi:hypothetical protein